MQFNKKNIIKSLAAFFAVIILSFGIFVGVRANQFKNFDSALPVSIEETQVLQSALRINYPDQYEILKNLPYKTTEPSLDVWAESAILIDIANGNVIYEKNADEVIPPASMTKLFAMYVVDEEVSAGRLSYDQIIPLPPESWACNMPPHSSLMFLGEGQRVTLEELLLGLSICSGNDAAYALAYTISGTMEAFVARMNQVAMDLGLEHTHFVESSGYSEENTTTAREMAKFCCVYLQQHPDSLQRYHAVPKFTYPKEHNLAPGDYLQAQDFSQGFPRHITMSITQQNTNPLLGRLDGVDGLKTGYIDESGYNLALTALRKGTRYLSVTMRGPGNSNIEGQKGRVHDGTELMNWAFSTFADYKLKDIVHPYFMKIYNAKQKGINLIPAYNPSVLTVPFVLGQSIDDNLSKIDYNVVVTDDKWGGLQLGQECGYIQITLGEYVLQTIPLVSDRNVGKSNFIVALADKIILTVSKKLYKI